MTGGFPENPERPFDYSDNLEIEIFLARGRHAFQSPFTRNRPLVIAMPRGSVFSVAVCFVYGYAQLPPERVPILIADADASEPEKAIPSALLTQPTISKPAWQSSVQPAMKGGSPVRRPVRPVLWDLSTGLVISNQLRELMILLNDHGLAQRETKDDGRFDLFPAPAKHDINILLLYVISFVSKPLAHLASGAVDDLSVSLTQRLYEALERLNDRLNWHSFLTGDQISGADLMLAAALRPLGRGQAPAWLEDFTGLARMTAALEHDPGIEAILPLVEEIMPASDPSAPSPGDG